MNYKESSPQYLISICTLSFTSASIAETITYPLDIVKTRRQLFGELENVKKVPSSYQISLELYRDHGLKSFYRGLAPSIYRQIAYTGLRIPLYETMRNYLLKAHADEAGNFVEDEETKLKIASKTLFAGVISGAISQYLASPFDVIKVQMQYYPNDRSLTTFRVMKILGKNGISTLWRGSLPNVKRAAIVNMVDMTAYDMTKRLLREELKLDEGIPLYFMASSLSGFLACVAGTPLDFIRTRMMGNPIKGSQTHYYKGMIDCAMQIARKEGILTFYRSFVMIWARMAPWNVTFWMTFEKLRENFNLGHF